MLEFDNVCVKYEKKEILKNISLQIKPHTLNVIIGKNASGKSTLLNTLTSEVKYTGKINYCGRDLALMSRKERAMLISCLSQNLPDVHLTVEELAALGRTPYLDVGQRFTEKDREETEKAIESIGISSIRGKYIDNLSGGEKQKAYLAMTLAQSTRITAFDEPTTYLDAEYQKEICNILSALKTRHKKTVIAVMHDITCALEIADNIIFLNEGEVVFSGKPQECIQTGLIEKIYNMKQYTYEAEGEKRILYR